MAEEEEEQQHISVISTLIHWGRTLAHWCILFLQGCRAILYILFYFFLPILPIYFIIFSLSLIQMYNATRQNAQVAIKKENSYAYYRWSNYCYFQYEISHNRFCPSNHIVARICGVLTKENNEKQYFIDLSFYYFFSLENREKILNDSHITEYNMTHQSQELSVYKEYGTIRIKDCNLLFHSKNNPDIVLIPFQDTIEAEIKFERVGSDYSHIEFNNSYYITEEQLCRLFGERITGLEYPLQIDGIDENLNILIRPKKIKRLYQRYKLIDKELDKIQKTLTKP